MDVPPREVAPEIQRSWTLPSEEYHDPERYARQCERVFARSWQVVQGADRIKAPGHVLPFELLPGCLDEPLLLARDDEHVLHCLSNVCTHRGALVVDGEGHRPGGLRCRYHGRRFALDGSFVSMPEFEEVEGFPAACDDLPELPLERWGPLRFTALDPVMAFDEWIGPVRERVDFLPVEEAILDEDGVREYRLRAHWALYVDNYLEEFHIPYVHGRSLSGLSYQDYRTERFSWGNLQLGVGKEGEPAFRLPPGHPEHGQRISAFYFWLFPGTMLNFYPWGVSVNVVEPLGPDRTKVTFLPWVWDETKRAEGVGSDLHRVEMEDEEVVESVQRGVRSRLYDRGRFSPRREVGTHHFHTLLVGVLGTDGSVAPAESAP